MSDRPGVAAGGGEDGQHILTVGLEDYFEVAAFRGLIHGNHWYRFERSVERATRKTLQFLSEHDVHATFFVMGWVADEMPELVRDVVAAGHEIATKGYYHKNVRRTSADEFREDLVRSREVIEAASGRRVLGYRAGDAWLGPEDLWALDVLAEEGFTYDSSVGLVGRRYAKEPWRRFVHTHTYRDHAITEYPISAARWLGQDVPIAGGNYFRQLPVSLIRRAVARWIRKYSAPFVMYFHTWEMDVEQPRIEGAHWLQKIRHYRNIQRMPELVGYFLERYDFTSVARRQGYDTELPEPRPAIARIGDPKVRRPIEIVTQPTAAARMPVTMVVPCFNEEVTIPYLNNTLERVRSSLLQYDLRFVFVDDASTDRTWESLTETFGERQDCVLVRQPENGGPARAILAGIRAAQTEVVCSIDCDCSYDPHVLASMIPLLGDDGDLVTASPYHPEGGVANVPNWRLFLSRGCSRLYRWVLSEKIHTFTACCRVYRKETVERVSVQRGGFLGIAELVGKLSLGGGIIREHPALLETRVMGRSSMKVARTIVGHVGLVWALGWQRLTGAKIQPIKQPSTASETTPATQHRAARA